MTANTQVEPGQAAFAAVTIAAADPPGAAAVFEQIAGVPSQLEAGVRTLLVAHTRLRIVQADGDRSGLVAVTLSVSSLESHLRALRLAGLPLESRDGQHVVPRASATGIEVSFEPPARPGGGESSRRAHLDHIALVVSDLQAATTRWTLLLGQPPAQAGPHPLGDSDTARFLLGQQMIELVSPQPGRPTAMRRRLETTGDGPIALALVPANLESAVAQLRASGIALLDQPPHVFVHPKRAGGVLVQLTPRLEHH